MYYINWNFVVRIISRMLRKTYLFFLPLLFVQPAFASDYYFGLNLGLADQSTKLNLQDSSVDPTVNIDYVKDYQAPDDSSGAYSVFLGYRLGRDIALEIGYVKNSELEGDIRTLNDGGVIDPDTSLPTDYLAKEDIESSFNYLALVGVWPVANNWSMNARLGVASWTLDYSQTVLNNNLAVDDPDREVRVESYSDSSSALFLGVGMSYGFSESMEIRLAYDFHAVDMNFTNVDAEYEVGMLSLGAALHF